MPVVYKRPLPSTVSKLINAKGLESSPSVRQTQREAIEDGSSFGTLALSRALDNDADASYGGDHEDTF